MNVTPMLSDPDEVDVRLAQQGQVLAFQRLFNRHHKRVFGLVWRLCGQTSLAEDLTQEVFVQVWQKLGSFRYESKFSTWLHTVASRVAISELRKERRWFRRLVSSSDESELDMHNTATLDSAPADLTELDRLIQKLPAQTRWVFVLHGLEGLRHDEVASQLNIAVGTSKAQFHRARQSLETWLGEGA